jgi:hypothetical protein
MEAEEFELGDILRGFGLQGTSSQTQQPATPSKLPISQRWLPPAFLSAVLAAKCICKSNYALFVNEIQT